MHAFQWFEGVDVWHVVGWTMLHFLWLGTLAGLAAGLCRLVLRRAPANVRYVAAVVCLAVLAGLPVAIAAWVGAKPQAIRLAVSSAVDTSAEIAPTAPGSAGGLTGSARPNDPMDTVPVIEAAPIAVPNTIPNPRQSRGLTDVFALVAGYLPWLWLIGTPLTFLLLATGVVGAERLRRSSRVIVDGPIADACARLVESLRIGRRVTVAVCERIAAPVLVGILRPIILLPPAALMGWSPDEIEMVLLHELAHVRRWDNLINLTQRFIEALLFFHPAVWMMSGWVRREREACCDAVVVGRTNRPHAYAELLVEFAALVSNPSEPGRPRPRFEAVRRGRGRPGSLVSSAMAAGPLRGRIRRILGLEDDPMLVSGKSLGVVMSGLLLAATLVVLNLPSRGQAEESTKQTEELTTEGTEDAEKGGAARRSELKSEDRKNGEWKNSFIIRSKFVPSDANRLETRSYKIADSSRAVLDLDSIAAVLSADESEPKPVFGHNWSYEFTRLEVVAPKEGQEFVASLLRNTLAVEKKALTTEGTKETSGEPIAALATMVEEQRLIAVPFVEGATRFVGDDKITIVEVRGAVETCEPGNTYLIRGKYTLGSRERAALSAFVTARNAGDGKTSIDKDQTMIVERGSGKFTFKLPMPYDGWPHVSFYPAEGGEGFGGVYFGTGNTVLKKWWGQKEADPRPTAADDEWLASLGEPPRKERVIAEKAWQRLGLKILPAYIKDLEQGAKLPEADPEQLIGLKIVGGNVPIGLPNPALLRQLNDQPIAGFDDLLAWLESEVGRSNRVVKCEALAAGHSFLIEARPLANAEGGGGRGYGMGGRGDGNGYGGETSGGRGMSRGESGGYREQRTDAEPKAATREAKTFPSLEDQKLADLAWKRLGVELEPIGTGDFQRVKALGYDGGLRVTSAGSLGGGRGGQSFETGDILVGLHVWPTTSLEEVAAVLNRGDLAELNPLKYYIVRTVTTGYGGGGGYGGRASVETARDAVITGRISVSLDEQSRQRRPTTDRYSAPTPATGSQSSSPLTYSDFASQPAAAKAGATVARPPAADANPFSAPTATGKPTLRYDGKTFDEWQTAWKTELSTEKRLDAVKALAAFGANGYGKEAAEAIVEIAGQYDWTSLGGNKAAGELKKACLSAFGYPDTSTVAHRIPELDALPALIAAVDSKNKQDRLFATWVLPVFAPQNKLAVEALLKLSADSDAEVRSFAFRMLNADSDPLSDRGIPARIRQELMSNDPQTTRMAIKTLVKDAAWFNNRGISTEEGPALNYTPELFPLLFAPDESVRKEARQAIRFAQSGSVSQIVEPLLSLLSDDARRVDHLEAIRALAAMGPKASPALDKLKQTLATSDPNVRIAAAAAIKMIVGKDQYQKPVADVLGEELGITVVESNGVWGALPRDDVKGDLKAFGDFTTAVIREQQQLFPDGKF